MGRLVGKVVNFLLGLVGLGNKSTPPRLQFITTSLANGKLGVFYNSGITLSGGKLPYFEIINGSLPPGLKIDGESQLGTFPISGMPTQAGSFTFTITVKDSSS